MPAFTAIVIDATGRRQTWHETAGDEFQLRERLRAKAVWPVKIQVEKNSKDARIKVPVGEFIPWLNQLELQLRAGVMPDVALNQLAEDAPIGPLRKMLGHIADEVARGSPIHQACRFFARQFPPHVAAVIAAGEASATLPESLRSLADHLAGADELRRTARRALIYPMIVLVAATGLIGFLLAGVVPKFADIFASLQVPLPALTRLLIASSRAMAVGWPWLAALGGGMGALLWMAARMPSLRYRRDQLLLRLPVWGDTVRCLATARFAAHCRLLHEAGIPMLDSLETAAELVNQAVLARQLQSARERVALGRPLYASLPAKHGFPAFIVPALKAGESTGQLAVALRHVETYATRRARERLATALALLEPVVLATLTGVVGAIALSFFLPLFSLLGGLNSR